MLTRAPRSVTRLLNGKLRTIVLLRTPTVVI